jgi:hypothetical protein
MAGSCESCNEHPDSEKCREFPDELRNCQFVKKDLAAYTKLLGSIVLYLHTGPRRAHSS